MTVDGLGVDWTDVGVSDFVAPESMDGRAVVGARETGDSDLDDAVSIVGKPVLVSAAVGVDVDAVVGSTDGNKVVNSDKVIGLDEGAGVESIFAGKIGTEKEG